MVIQQWTRVAVFGLLAIICLPLSPREAAALDDLRAVAIVASGSDEADAFCSDFTLTPVEAMRALRAAKRVTKPAYLDAYDWLPCYVRGTAVIAGAGIQWELRAGGNGTLSYADGSTVFVGCEVCRRSFGATHR
jgi:hypothetical protein